MGDTGLIEGLGGEFAFEVHDTKRTGQVYVHMGDWVRGSHEQLKIGTPARATVDAERRDAIRRNHTATHLLHWALHQVLDRGATQKGSEVSPNRLRFDFAWSKQVDADALREVEQLVNQRITENALVRIEEVPIAEARERGAIAMFGEKYGELVRVIEVGDFSVELCGGTHVDRTGDIGLFKIVQEGSVSEGVRRLNAYTGEVAVAKSHEDSALLGRLAQELKAKPDELVERLRRMQEEIRELHKKNREALTRRLPTWEELKATAQKKKDVWFLAAEVEGAPLDALRQFGDAVKRQTEPFVAFLIAREDGGKVPLITALSQPLVDRGWHSRDLLRPVAQVLGGGGGGNKADMCQGSGKDPSQIPAALAEAEKQVDARLG